MKWFKRLYERMFAELFLFFHQNRERYADWQAVVIYPNRATEQEEVRPYRHLLESEQVHRVYLDELGNIRQLFIVIDRWCGCNSTRSLTAYPIRSLNE